MNTIAINTGNPPHPQYNTILSFGSRALSEQWRPVLAEELATGNEKSIDGNIVWMMNLTNEKIDLLAAAFKKAFEELEEPNAYNEEVTPRHHNPNYQPCN